LAADDIKVGPILIDEGNTWREYNVRKNQFKEMIEKREKMLSKTTSSLYFSNPYYLTHFSPPNYYQEEEKDDHDADTKLFEVPYTPFLLSIKSVGWISDYQDVVDKAKRNIRRARKVDKRKVLKEEAAKDIITNSDKITDSIISFLDPKSVARLSIVNSVWKGIASMYPSYLEMANMKPIRTMVLILSFVFIHFFYHTLYFSFLFNHTLYFSFLRNLTKGK